MTEDNLKILGLLVKIEHTILEICAVTGMRPEVIAEYVRRNARVSPAYTAKYADGFLAAAKQGDTLEMCDEWASKEMYI